MCQTLSFAISSNSIQPISSIVSDQYHVIAFIYFWKTLRSCWWDPLDYLHITKRFGVIAASQFPLHYMLSMKSLYSPLAFLFRSSHEQLNPWHRLSGRVIYFLLICHATWYMNFFVQAGVLTKRLRAPVVIIGIVAFFFFNTIFTTFANFS